MVLILGLIVGKWNEQKEASEEKGLDTETNEITHRYDEEKEDNTKESNDEKDSNFEKEDERPEESPYGEDYDGYEEIIPGEVDESELAPSYDEMYDADTIKESKKTAESFIKTFYNLTDEDLRKYIKKSKKYMTDELYEEEIESPENVQADKMKRKFIEAEMIEPNKKPPEGEGIIWVARVEGKITDIHNKESGKTDIYIMYLEQVNDGWKINDYMVNMPF